MNDVLVRLRAAAHRERLATDAGLLGAFVDRRDEAAFEALLHRHGPTVLGVCRRIAGAGPDAEDAFQAAFLVLARKAHVVRPRAALAGWLHGVAVRAALKVRSNEAGQITMSLRVNGKSAGFGFATRDTPGAFEFTNFGTVGKERDRLRAGVGKRVRVVVGVSDFKRNHARIVRTVRLTR